MDYDEDDDGVAMGARGAGPARTPSAGPQKKASAGPQKKASAGPSKKTFAGPQRPTTARRGAPPPRQTTTQRKPATQWKTSRPKTIPIHGWRNPVNARQASTSVPSIRRTVSRFAQSNFRAHLPHFMNRYLYTQPANTSASVAALHAILDQADEAFQNGSQVPMAELAAAFAAVVAAMSAPADPDQQ